MSEAEAYARLQELLEIVEELTASGHYDTEEIINEVRNLKP